MSHNGWSLGVHQWQNNHPKVVPRCRRGRNWFGWSNGRSVGTVATTLTGNGIAILNYGNCWTSGWVRVRLNNKLISQALKNQRARIARFRFRHGDRLTITDEGSSSKIAINS